MFLYNPCYYEYIKSCIKVGKRYLKNEIDLKFLSVDAVTLT